MLYVYDDENLSSLSAVIAYITIRYIIKMSNKSRSATMIGFLNGKKFKLNIY